MKVDNKDFIRLSKFSWNLNANLYAQAHMKGKTITAHRFLLLAARGEEVDHEDRDKLNNQRSNLRFCSRAENQRNRGTPKSNTSGFKGVYWKGTAKKWCAGIKFNGKTMHLGHFDKKEDAYLARRKAEELLFGDFASA